MTSAPSVAAIVSLPSVPTFVATWPAQLGSAASNAPASHSAPIGRATPRSSVPFARAHAAAGTKFTPRPLGSSAIVGCGPPFCAGAGASPIGPPDVLSSAPKPQVGSGSATL
jgi:hypothetical protein